MNIRFGYAPSNLTDIKTDLNETNYDAHIYYTPETANDADKLRDTYSKILKSAKDVKVDQELHDVQAPFHNQTEFEIKFPARLLGPMVHLLSKTHGKLTVLVHEFDVRRLVPTHTTEAFWMGPTPDPLPINVDAFVRRQAERDAEKTYN